jgi:hypothetical protein
MTKKTVLLMIVALFSLSLIASCASVMAPTHGSIYTGVKAGQAATSADGKAVKMGTSKCTNVLGIAAWGDCSIDAAAKNGNISQIHHVDYDAFSVLGVYARFTTMVYGD